MELFANKKPTILVVDDETSIRESFSLILEDNYKVITAASGEVALKKLVDEPVSLIFLDIRMPGMDGIETLSRIREIDKDVIVVMVTAVADVQKAGEAIKLGAFNYVVKPFDVELIQSTAKNLIEKKNIIKETEKNICKPVIEFEKPKEISSFIEKASQTEQCILICGEPGVEIDEIVYEIHSKSVRADQALRVFNIPGCAQKKIIREALFGIGKGSFSYEFERHIGLVEICSGGTLVLNNIENLPSDIALEIINVIEDKSMTRDGGFAPISVNTRIIAATSSDLKHLSGKGSFNKKLYSLISNMILTISPLRSRKNDIYSLADFLLHKFNKKYNKNISKFSKIAMDALSNYNWPGNSRELASVIDTIVLSKEGPEIFIEDLPIDIIIHGVNSVNEKGSDIGLESIIESFDKEFIYSVLKKCDFDRSKATKILGFGQNVLSTKIESLNLDKTA